MHGNKLLFLLVIGCIAVCDFAHAQLINEDQIAPSLTQRGLDQVAGYGRAIAIADEPDKAIEIGGPICKRKIYEHLGGGLIDTVECDGVENDVDWFVSLATNRKWCVRKKSNGDEIFCVREDGTIAGEIITETRRIGSDSGSALADTADEATIWRNNLGGSVTLLEVWAESDAGTPIINLQRDDGSAANVLSSNLTVTTSGVTGTIAAAESVFAVGDKLDFVMVTAGGAAKRVTLNLKFRRD